jgi:CHAD domain-containing protein
MRVATRRLRAALEIFETCFPRREYRAALQEVKRLADALGERRDRDVAIASLGQIAESMSAPDRPGIETLITRLRTEQTEANEALEHYVADQHLLPLCEQLQELITGIGVPSGKAPATGPPVVPPSPSAASDNGAAATAEDGA